MKFTQLFVQKSSLDFEGPIFPQSPSNNQKDARKNITNQQYSHKNKSNFTDLIRNSIKAIQKKHVIPQKGQNFIEIKPKQGEFPAKNRVRDLSQQKGN